MRIAQVFLIASLVGSLIGCATSSGILPIGKNTFTVTIQSDTASSAKEKAINEANAFCAKSNQSIEVARMLPSSDAWGWHSYEVNFKCIN